MSLQIQQEFDRLGERSEWLASYSIDGTIYGSGLNHDEDVRPGPFFALVPHARRILELGSCQGGGTFQLAKRPGVEEIVAVEGRDYNVEKARLVQRLLGITNVTFVEANLETFDLKSLGRFDAVYCVGLLYHLPKPWELLAKLKEVSDVLYLNTHYCRANCVSRTVDGHEGANWREFGYRDPLSGLSNWSFWPTLKSLTKILLDAGYVPEILETDSTARGQCPHGTTILGRQEATLAKSEKDRLARNGNRACAVTARSWHQNPRTPCDRGGPVDCRASPRIAGFCPAVLGRSRRQNVAVSFSFAPVASRALLKGAYRVSTAHATTA